MALLEIGEPFHGPVLFPLKLKAFKDIIEEQDSETSIDGNSIVRDIENINCSCIYL